ncbi:MAG: glycosyltransferase family 4 protein [Cyclobacteriaceae bacterium]|nr:glycosyltransferase family 4 protein [Cyclobacteriaceae bacterium]
MNQLKIVFIISHVHKSLQLEWMIDGLVRKNIQLSFILLGQSKTELSQFLHDKNLKVFHIPLAGKVSMILAFFKVFSILRREKPQVVHTHLYHANLIGLFAARLLGIKRRIYTRHHATLHHQYYPKAVYIDRFINKLATHIIIPSNSLYETLVNLEGVHSDKIRSIPHGFDLAYFSTRDTTIEKFKSKYKLKGSHPVVGVIARHTEWKGIQFIIPAFREILKEYPNAHLVLANAGGDFEKEIAAMMLAIPDANQTIIPFENDVAPLYHCFDIFIHAPIDSKCEAFGQTYVEALAAGIPSIFTLSGIANEFIVNGVNALVVDYKQSEMIAFNIRRLLNDPPLSKRLIEQGRVYVEKRFSIDQMTTRLEKLYLTGE